MASHWPTANSVRPEASQVPIARHTLPLPYQPPQQHQLLSIPMAWLWGHHVTLPCHMGPTEEPVFAYPDLMCVEVDTQSEALLKSLQNLNFSVHSSSWMLLDCVPHIRPALYIIQDILQCARYPAIPYTGVHLTPRDHVERAPLRSSERRHAAHHRAQLASKARIRTPFVARLEGDRAEGPVTCGSSRRNLSSCAKVCSGRLQSRACIG